MENNKSKLCIEFLKFELTKHGAKMIKDVKQDKIRVQSSLNEEVMKSVGLLS
jgi:hypothetical protein